MRARGAQRAVSPRSPALNEQVCSYDNSMCWTVPFRTSSQLFRCIWERTTKTVTTVRSAPPGGGGGGSGERGAAVPSQKTCTQPDRLAGMTYPNATHWREARAPSRSGVAPCARALSVCDPGLLVCVREGSA